MIFLDQIVASLGLQIKISLQYKKNLNIFLEDTPLSEISALTKTKKSIYLRNILDICLSAK